IRSFTISAIRAASSGGEPWSISAPSPVSGCDIERTCEGAEILKGSPSEVAARIAEIVKDRMSG
ncbi:MAG TPA: hypothetical protein VHF45_11970, partial [Thermoleophilaceae bacterium]|nr:hypothetical protein [Thermoleophilaceae bacterium]